ncbi:MAG TPA: nitroreductase family protein [Enhygromyxa sp.]|nr:nitroreductase family protein [Enhygromyxa sp.]
MSKPADTDKPLLEAIAKRWSPRAFAEREPTDAELELVFEAARWAASCFNDQPWRYILVRRTEPEFADALAGLVESNQAWAREAPVLGFSLAQPSFTQTGKPNMHAWHDVGAASALLSIQAASIGLLVHQMAGIQRDVVRERFAVPDQFEVVAGLAMGWPGDPQQLAEPYRERELAPRSRRALSETLIRGRFGESE